VRTVRTHKYAMSTRAYVVRAAQITGRSKDHVLGKHLVQNFISQVCARGVCAWCVRVMCARACVRVRVCVVCARACVRDVCACVCAWCVRVCTRPCTRCPFCGGWCVVRVC
jgi:hypothetical protein